ncbi:MAG: hypothetical protein B6U89_01305 [Desulfurococcales archaeon ex4484_58]|nr:MAG: hypothetical protein B6U89_01305 [Desulfurococcales archaeon ex4484_58]
MSLPYTSVHVKLVEVNGSKLLGVEIELPNAPPLIVLRGNRGFIMCGYLDIKVADKLGLVAGRVVGVSSVDELLDKEIVEASSKAIELGIKPGVKVKEVINVL